MGTSIHLKPEGHIYRPWSWGWMCSCDLYQNNMKDQLQHQDCDKIITMCQTCDPLIYHMHAYPEPVGLWSCLQSNNCIARYRWTITYETLVRLNCCLYRWTLKVCKGARFQAVITCLYIRMYMFIWYKVPYEVHKIIHMYCIC